MKRIVCALLTAVVLLSSVLSVCVFADTVIGDVNRDGNINNKDVVTLFRYVNKAVTSVDTDAADINGDGNINNKDVVLLFRFISSGNVAGVGTPAYTVSDDGKTVTVNGIEYPNIKNITNGATYAVDDLGRQVRMTGDTYVSDGSKNVGIFYFLWLGQHGDYGVFDITKILERGGEAAKSTEYEGWGPVGAMHFWGEPLYGYYFSNDKWVMRRHINELTDADIDFVYIDATNGYPYLSNAKSLMNIMHAYNERGFKAPQIVFYTHSQCASTVKKIYDSIYATNFNSDTWLKMDGKPVIIAYESQCRASLGDEICDKFTFREPQWPNEGQKTNGWPWMDFNYPQRVFINKNGKKEAISVSVAQHNATVCFSDSAIYGRGNNRGRSYHNGKKDTSDDATLYGYNFQEQWDRAISANVPYVLVTGWNEWVAQRQNAANTGRASTEAVFIDTASMEYSRDIEPMRGGYFDNYYMQLIDNVRRYKGVAPTLVQNTRKTIDINGGFDQWNDVLVEYADMTSDKGNRSNAGFGSSTYTDKTGRNDIAAAKVIYDLRNVYFYVETSADITALSSKTSWMQLFINTDMKAETGFYGFDRIVNYKAKDGKTTTVARAVKNGTDYAFEECGEVEYRVEGNKMMIKVPLNTLGIGDFSKISFAFKWVDSKTNITSMEQMYTEGDCAPHGRLSFVFRNYK